jgi:hypothetical protein
LHAWPALGKLALVAIVLGVSFAMLVAVLGPRSPWLGLMLMFDFLGLGKFAEPLFRFRMPRPLRTVAPGRFAGGIYRGLGVRGFGALLRHTPLRHLNGAVYLAGGARSLAEVSVRAESAEAIHFWAAVLFTPYIVYVGARGFIAETILLALIQVVFNVYPMLHLRLVRARLDRVAEAASARRGESIQSTGDA